MAQKKAPIKKTKVIPREPQKKVEAIERNPKLADPGAILKKYDELKDQLARVESAQRNAGKPYRIYFIHRRKIEVMKMNFIKSMR